MRLLLNRLLYNGLITLLLPLLFVRLWLKGKRAPAYRERWAERLGFFSPPGQTGGICFHCVSVGETLAAVALIKQVQQQLPHCPVTVTSTTPTGSARVKAAFGDTVFAVYLPFDTPGAVQRFFKRIQPRLLVLVETELWPNLLFKAKQNHCHTLLANARLSAKSAAGYQKFATLSQAMINSLTKVAAHHDDDGQRFVALGLNRTKLEVIGSIKFDVHIDASLQQQGRDLKQLWAPQRPVWVVGSTHQGEDEVVLAAFKQVLASRPDTLLILVPRHPERFEQVNQLIQQQHLQVCRRSGGQVPQAGIQVVLGDTMGELMLLWSVADVALVGGSLVERGGHNPLEPAAFGIPVLSGPHVFNFSAIYRLLAAQDALLTVKDADSLAQAVLTLLQDQPHAAQMGHNAQQVVEQNRGAQARLQSLIMELY